MRALLAKELAENARWASLACVVLLLLLLGFHHFDGRSGTNPAYSLEVHLSACWFALAWAVTLAFLQFLRDARDEFHGLLVHRNASIDAITWSKLLAGTVLLVASLGIPLLVAGLSWLAPSPDAPPFFLVDMTHLAMAIACVSISGYAAAAAIAARSSRWWTTRCVPIFIPIVIIVASWNGVLFACLAAAVVLPCLVTAIIAWQRAGGRDRQLGWGGVTAWSVCALLPLAALVMIQVKADETEKVSINPPMFYLLQSDGSIAVCHNDAGGHLWFSDLDGAKLAHDRWATQASMCTVIPDPDAEARMSPIARWNLSDHWFDPARFRLNRISDDKRTRIYYSASQASLIATDAATGRMLGYVTSAGIAPDRAELLSDETIALSTGVVFDAGMRDVYLLEKDAPRLRRIFSVERDEALGRVAWIDTSEKFFWIGTSRRIVRVALDGTLLAAYAIRSDLRGASVGIARDDANGRWTCKVSKRDWQSGLHEYFLTLSDPGGIVTVRELPEVPVEHVESVADAGAVATLEPPALAIAQSHGRLAPALSMLGTLAAAVLAFLLCRRCCLHPLERALWCASILALGALPLAPLIALRGGIVRERCHACGRWRLVTRERCEHCGAPFPAPPPSPYAIRDAEAPARDLAALAP
jgi:hypothetical protein